MKEDGGPNQLNSVNCSKDTTIKICNILFHTLKGVEENNREEEGGGRRRKERSCSSCNTQKYILPVRVKNSHNKQEGKLFLNQKFIEPVRTQGIMYLITPFLLCLSSSKAECILFFKLHKSTSAGSTKPTNGKYKCKVMLSLLIL